MAKNKHDSSKRTVHKEEKPVVEEKVEEQPFKEATVNISSRAMSPEERQARMTRNLHLRRGGHKIGGC